MSEKNRTSVVSMQGITKNFDKLLALDNVNLELYESEILALLGENGSGKTTLMNVLFGIYFPDAGSIKVRDQYVCIRNPRDARELGIGMVPQHARLVDVLSVAENIELGLPGKAVIDKNALHKKIQEIADHYGFPLDPAEKVYNLSVSQKQMVEIVKVLYRGADILILDEPTAVLTPQEIERLFTVMRSMKAEGKSLIIITHKLQEVLSVSDRVTVLRKGQRVGSVPTAEADAALLTELMIGHKVSLKIDRPPVGERRETLQIHDLCCRGADGREALKNVSFTAYGGEILGISGISGSGQKELCEAITGMQKVSQGSILFRGDDEKMVELVGKDPSSISHLGISMAFVPEDRLGMGLVPSLGMTDNILLRSYSRDKGFIIDREPSAALSRQLVEQLSIVTPDLKTPIRHLSGGNVQKILVGREIALNPRLLIVAYPVRGLDINSSYTIYSLLNEQKQKGVAVIFVGEDLDVLMELSDRLLVLRDGEVAGIVDPRESTKEEVGFMMVESENAEESQGAGSEEAV